MLSPGFTNAFQLLFYSVFSWVYRSQELQVSFNVGSWLWWCGYSCSSKHITREVYYSWHMLENCPATENKKKFIILSRYKRPYPAVILCTSVYGEVWRVLEVEWFMVMPTEAMDRLTWDFQGWLSGTAVCGRMQRCNHLGGRAQWSIAGSATKQICRQRDTRKVQIQKASCRAFLMDALANGLISSSFMELCYDTFFVRQTMDCNIASVLGTPRNELKIHVQIHKVMQKDLSSGIKSCYGRFHLECWCT